METEYLLPSPEPDNHGMLWQVPVLSLQGLEECGPLHQALQSSLQLVQLGSKQEGQIVERTNTFYWIRSVYSSPCLFFGLKIMSNQF